MGFPELAAKALNSGNFYLLSRAEYDDVTSKHAVPVPMLFNKIQEEETEAADIRCYGGTSHGSAFMWNKAFSVTCRERFELQNFPFDIQDLTLDFRLNDPRTWDLFDLSIVSVQFHKQALVQTEWRAFGPVIKRDSPAHKVSKVTLKYGRLSWFYVQNVVLAMFAISSLALLAFFMEISDLGSRVSTCLTVVLTIVAFKFITASSLPKVPYNTVVDHYINAASGSLILVTYCSVIPFVITTDDGGELINKALGWSSCVLLCFVFIAWVLYALRVANSWQLTKKITVTDKNWYSFRFSTPDFLDVQHSAAPLPLNSPPAPAPNASSNSSGRS